MGRNQAHRHARVSAVEQAGLHNDSRPRLAVVSRRRCDSIHVFAHVVDMAKKNPALFIPVKVG